jgi:rhamnulose-1-phosphate aldolase
MINKIFSKYQDIESIMTEVQEISGILWERGWSEKNAGNISIKLPISITEKYLHSAVENKFAIAYPDLKGKCFYITGTCKRMYDISKSAIGNGVFIQINNSGSAYYIVKINSEDIRPSSEFYSHMGIHNLIAKRGSNEKVVMHTHSTEIIALTHNSKIKSTEDLNRLLWGMHPEAIEFIPKGVGLVPYNLSGTQEIARLSIEEFNNHDIVVWEKHGILAIGKSLVETFDSIDITCKLAKIWFLCKSAGFEPEGMTDFQISEKKLNT